MSRRDVNGVRRFAPTIQGMMLAQALKTIYLDFKRGKSLHPCFMKFRAHDDVLVQSVKYNVIKEKGQ